MLKNTIAGTFAFCLIGFLVILTMASRLKPKPPPSVAPQPVPAATLPTTAAGAKALLPAPPPPPPREDPPALAMPSAEAKRVLEELGNVSMPLAMKTPADLLKLIPGMPDAATLAPEKLRAIELAMVDARHRDNQHKDDLDARLGQMADEVDLRGGPEEIPGRDQNVNLGGVQRFVLSRVSGDKMKTYTFLESDYPDLFAEALDRRRAISEQLLRDAIAAVREGKGE